MKLPHWLILLVLFLSGTAAHALSPLFEIQRKSANDPRMAFDIRSEPVARGDVKFTVTIREGTLKLREKFGTSLARVHVTEHSSESSGVRELPNERKDGTVTCVFTVTAQELQDPDLSFYFDMPVPGAPAKDHYYAPLEKFVPRRFPTVDGIFRKAEYIDTNPKTKERLDIRYGPISDSGIELELTTGDTIVWREYIQPLGVPHSKYRQNVFVRVNEGKISVVSIGAKRIVEVRDLKTGRQISRIVDNEGTQEVPQPDDAPAKQAP